MSIEKFFNTIRDGTWHHIDELADQLGVPTEKLTDFLKFLSEREVATYEEKTRRIKLQPTWKLLLPDDDLE